LRPIFLAASDPKPRFRRRFLTKGLLVDLNHLHLAVKDLDTSKSFYEKFLGFREHVRHGKILFLTNNFGFDLALSPDHRPAQFPDWFHFGFRLKDKSKLEALYSEMSRSQVSISKSYEEDKDFAFFRCIDPDGYKLELYWEPANEPKN
jgi:catechol 2,3-dioxygenase-like lactoylglutathione lyase family enzyme